MEHDESTGALKFSLGRASRGALEALGPELTFSEFHVTINDTGLRHYYRVNGRRIYRTAKLSGGRTATASDHWDKADTHASGFLALTTRRT
jgi:hypothetical protein